MYAIEFVDKCEGQMYIFKVYTVVTGKGMSIKHIIVDADSLESATKQAEEKASKITA